MLSITLGSSSNIKSVTISQLIPTEVEAKKKINKLNKILQHGYGQPWHPSQPYPRMEPRSHS